MLPIAAPPAVSRQHLLETCFSEIPQKIGSTELRKLSPASFALLGRLGSPMMTGGAGLTLESMFEAVVLYLWIHSADLDLVCAIESTDDLPHAEIRKFGFGVDFGNALGFLETYKRCSARMAAALAEVEEDEDEEPGKHANPEPSRAGSPLSFTPSEDAPIPGGSATFYGSCPSNEPLPISTPPTPPTEHAAAGFTLPDLRDPTSSPQS